MDALDAQLIASLENRLLGIAVDSPAESLEPVPASRYLESICPSLKFDHIELKQENPQPTMLLISVNVSFDPSGPKNHWCPAWRKDSLDPEDSFKLTRLEDDRIRNELRANRLLLLEAEDIDPSEIQDPMAHLSAVDSYKREILKFLSCVFSRSHLKLLEFVLCDII